MVGEGGDVDVAGVVVPDGAAESADNVAGVEGGGRGEADESASEDHVGWAGVR